MTKNPELWESASSTASKPPVAVCKQGPPRRRRRRRTGVRGEAPGLPQSPAEGCWPCQAADRVVGSRGCGSPGTRGFFYLAAASAHLGLHRRGWQVIARSQEEVPGLCQRTDPLDHADWPPEQNLPDVLEPTWEGDQGLKSRQGGGALTQSSAPPCPADRNAAREPGTPLSRQSGLRRRVMRLMPHRGTGGHNSGPRRKL